MSNEYQYPKLTAIFLFYNDKGCTPIHTALTAGRSVDVLRWLMKIEEILFDESAERNITLRTDYPGGALPLHSAAACPSFDGTASTAANMHPFNTYPLKCTVTNNIISAYESTTLVLKAYPQAIWEVDCEGETPLHAASSWGNVGSVLALLIGAGASETLGQSPSTEVAKAALTTDDRNKSPLNRACERLCSMCVHGRENTKVTNRSSFRRSVARDDPFQEENDTSNVSLNEGRRSLLRSSQRGSGRRRIPGCGSSFRSSFSSSFTRGDSLLDMGEEAFRESFKVISRRPIDPSFGLEALDCDGQEEYAKIELLARAGYGFFEGGGSGSETITHTDNFQLLHAAISLGCPPEVVWHVGAANTHQVEEKDAFGLCPLFLACKRFVALYSQHLQHTMNSLKKEAPKAVMKERGEDAFNNKVGIESQDETGSKFVESLLLGGDYSHLLENAHQQSTEPSHPQQPNQPLPETPPTMAEVESESNPDDDLIERMSLSKEVINILLHSSLFGKPEMASITDNEGRLPLHILLEVGVYWVDGDDTDNKEQYSTGGRYSYNVAQALADVYPRALEIKDGKSRLLPFMIAATHKACYELENEECTKQLETIFQLLVRAPNAISLCMS